MPRCNLHLPSKDHLSWDQQGIDLPDPTIAQGAADKTAAELRGGLLHESKGGCCWTVPGTHEGDQLVHVTSL
jgi:hypothetical protein